MSHVRKHDETPIKWACITLHERLPSKVDQIASARAWGAVADWLAGMEVSSTYVDDVRGVSTTNWPGKLVMRAALLTALSVTKSPRNHVFFRSPLCVGFTPKHAQETVEAIFAENALVYVGSLGLLFRSGDDMAEFYETVRLEMNAAHARLKRARAKESN